MVNTTENGGDDHPPLPLPPSPSPSAELPNPETETDHHQQLQRHQRLPTNEAQDRSGGRPKEPQQQQQQQQQQQLQFCFENLPSYLTSDSDNHPQRRGMEYLVTALPNDAATNEIKKTTNGKTTTAATTTAGGRHNDDPSTDTPLFSFGSNNVQRRRRHQRQQQQRSLSDNLMRCLSGLGSGPGGGGVWCVNCRIVDNGPTSGDGGVGETICSTTSEAYNLQALRRTLPTVSPFVSGPMMLELVDQEVEEDRQLLDQENEDRVDEDKDDDENERSEHNGARTNKRQPDNNSSNSNNSNTKSAIIAGVSSSPSAVVATAEQLLVDYMVACQFYKVQYNAGVMTCLRFALPCLRVSGPFHDDDMLALVEVLLKHANNTLKHIIRLDFSVASREGRRTATHTTKSMMGFTSHGAFALAKLLQTTHYVSQVWLPRHRIGPYGASALFLACRHNPTIKVLNLRRCRIGEKGALAFCELILGQRQQSQQSQQQHHHQEQPQQQRQQDDQQQDQQQQHRTRNIVRHSTTNISTSSNKNYNQLLQEEANDQLSVSTSGSVGAISGAATLHHPAESTIGLVDVDLSANLIGHHGTMSIENALESLRLQRQQQRRRQQQYLQNAPDYDEYKNDDDDGIIFVHLEGNLVFPEILNGVTHGVGVLLSLTGGYALWERVSTMSTWTHTISCTIYTISLLALYLSSTLYHSLFILVNTRYVFQVMDKCAIYILIAGSYTPYLQILMNDRPVYSYGLLALIWLCATLGISVEAFRPTWKWKRIFSLSMYLGMGWCAVICIPALKDRIESGCIRFLVLGGVGYTAGVPFFIRNNNLDHAIWHLFVLSGSIFHWLGCYFYVASHPLPAESASCPSEF